MTPSDLQNKMSSLGLPEYGRSPRVAKVRRIFSDFPDGMRVLDVGCANGVLLQPLIQKHDIHGVDISESLIKLANEAGIKAVTQDFASKPLPYPDKSFDAVLFAETIEHHVDTDWVMSEVNRVLKPGAKLVLTFPNVRTVVSLLMMLFLDLPPMFSARYRSAHYRDFTLRLIKLVLQNHKFTMEKATGTAFFFPRIGEFWSPLATFFPSWSNAVIVVATKTGDSHYSEDEATASHIY